MVTWDQFVWPPGPDTLETVWVARYNGGWHTAEMVSTHAVGKGWGSSASMDASGNAVLFWTYYNPLGSDPRALHAARWDATAGSWTDQGLLHGDPAVDLYHHQGAIGTNLEACVAWLQNDTEAVGLVWLPDDPNDISTAWDQNFGISPAAAMATDCIVATVQYNMVRLHVWGVRPW